MKIPDAAKLMHQPVITISDRDGGYVAYRETLHGRVHPTSLVQVIVKSKDGKFYLQKDAKVTGHLWECDVVFGYENNVDSLHEFHVTALVASKIKKGKLDEIPESIVSATASFTRIR